MSYQRILVALDRTSLADLVFDQAVDLAQKEKARLLLFHAIQIQVTGEVSPMMGTGIGLIPTGRTTLPQVQQQRIDAEIEQTQKFLETHAQKAADLGITTEIDHQVGDPGPTICDIATRWAADLIIVGRRGRKGMTEMFLGSVSNHISHNAPCSVLIVQGIQPTL